MRRRNQVLRKMAQLRMVQPETAQTAMERPLGVKLSRYYTGRRESFFFDYVRQELVDKYGADRVRKGGLRIYTTIDLGKNQCVDLNVVIEDQDTAQVDITQQEPVVQPLSLVEPMLEDEGVMGYHATTVTPASQSASCPSGTRLAAPRATRSSRGRATRASESRSATWRSSRARASGTASCFVPTSARSSCARARTSRTIL